MLQGVRAMRPLFPPCAMDPQVTQQLAGGIQQRAEHVLAAGREAPADHLLQTKATLCCLFAATVARTVSRIVDGDTFHSIGDSPLHMVRCARAFVLWPAVGVLPCSLEYGDLRGLVVGIWGGGGGGGGGGSREGCERRRLPIRAVHTYVRYQTASHRVGLLVSGQSSKSPPE